jgi:hypothetical protein
MGSTPVCSPHKLAGESPEISEHKALLTRSTYLL